jgi:hypothetical protein
MIWFPMLFAIVIAALLSLVFGAGFRRYGPREGLVSFFVVLLLAAWAGSLWAQPVGPPFLGFYWLPVFLLTLLVALVLASTGPRYRTEPGHPAREEARGETSTRAAEEYRERTLDGFFWVVLGLLILMILLGYWL